MIKKLFVLSVLVAFVGLSAQKTHTVVKGDTPYNISKKYNISVDELYRLNPSAKSGSISIGQVLTVKSASPTKAPVTENKTVALGKIILQPKQTIYGITKQYKISEAELRKLNPELDDHMKIGDEITLPLSSIKKYGGTQAVVVTAQKTHTVVKGDTPYNISKKYNISVDELYRLNPSAKSGSISIGQVLTVKSASPTKAPVTENKTVALGKIILQPKQTIYGITKQYKISEAELRKLNPELDDHMKIGDEITLPLSSIKKYGGTQAVVVTEQPLATPNLGNKTKIDSGNERNSASLQEDEYVTYTVEAGDTVFSIVNKYGISIDELIALNPDLSKGLKTGMVLKVKKLDPAYSKKTGDALNVVLMLPFGYSTNDSRYRSMALDFLTGAKLAIERNARNGQKLDVKIVDSGNEASFRNSLTQLNPNNTDLVIGPFFKSNVIDLLDFTKTQKIPVVAPFANSSDLFGYNNLIILETSDQTYADKIVEEVKAVYSNQKIYVVADAKKDNANYLKAGFEKTLKNANVVIVNSPSEIQLDQNMMTGQSAPVIAVLANDNDTVGEAFSNKIISLSKEVQGLKAFSMYAVPSFDKKVDELSQASLVYLMDRKINTEGSFEKEILDAYKAKYCKTPGKYAVIGFDVVNDMLTRENKKGEIFKQMNKVQTQLATKFEFERVKANGAYINKGFRVIRLVP